MIISLPGRKMGGKSTTFLQGEKYEREKNRLKIRFMHENMTHSSLEMGNTYDSRRKNELHK